MNIREKLAKDFEKIGIKEAVALLEIPPKDIGADFALPCFKIRKKPEEIANLLKSDIVKRAEPKGGYLNIFIDWEKAGPQILSEILRKKQNYCKGKPKSTLLVEHTSANPDGPLHIGHFRNSVLGDSIARIMKFCGYRTRTEFYVNDMGRQIAIAVFEYLRHGKERGKEKPDWWVVDMYVKGNKRIEDNPMLEEEIRRLMELFESGDKKIRACYKKIVDACLDGHRQTLSEIGIKIDNFRLESTYLTDVKNILAKLKRHLRYDGKRAWLDMSKWGIERQFTLTRSDGTTIYPARDLAYHADKFKRARYNIVVIGCDQKLYFEQLKNALSLIYPEEIKRYKIVFYEHLKLPEGRISTRKGSFISVDELVKEAKSIAAQIVEEKMPGYSMVEKQKIADAVGIGALKWTMLRISPEKGCVWTDEALRFDGDTAPYVQYTYARARSVLRNAGDVKPKVGVLNDKREIAILKLLSEFGWVLFKAERDLRPHYIANYALDLSDAFNEFYQNVPILKSENIQARLALTFCVAEMLKLCLNLLGIEALERM
ncbi:MAG: arginine--tRNA ligase [Candidatus Aenigmatarchaeota archaeon]